MLGGRRLREVIKGQRPQLHTERVRRKRTPLVSAYFFTFGNFFYPDISVRSVTFCNSVHKAGPPRQIERVRREKTRVGVGQKDGGE